MYFDVIDIDFNYMFVKKAGTLAGIDMGSIGVYGIGSPLVGWFRQWAIF